LSKRIAWKAMLTYNVEFVFDSNKCVKLTSLIVWYVSLSIGMVKGNSNNAFKMWYYTIVCYVIYHSSARTMFSLSNTFHTLIGTNSYDLLWFHVLSSVVLWNFTSTRVLYAVICLGILLFSIRLLSCCLHLVL